jgi:hypothetical protein
MDRRRFDSGRRGHDWIELMQPTAKLSVRWVSSVEDIPLDLWARCFAPPLEGPWWYRTLDRSGLESQFTFAYAIIERGFDPVGIAPAFLMDVPIDLVARPMIARLLRVAGKVIPRLRYQRTLFVGSPCSDEGTVGLLPGVVLAEVGPIIHDALSLRARQVGASMIVWKDFPDTASAALELLCASRGLFKLVSYPGTRLPLPGGGFSTYLQTLTSHNRYNLRSKLRRSKEAGDLHVTVLQRPNPLLLDEIFALFWQTYQKGKTKFEILTPRFFQLIAAEDVSHFILLRHPQTGKLVAFMLCFRIGPRVVNKFIGLDYGFDGSWFLYFRLWEQAIDWASRIGATDFLSGQTVYRAKLDLGHRLIPLTNYCQHRNPFIHHLFARVARNISWATLDKDLAHHSTASG